MMFVVVVFVVWSASHGLFHRAEKRNAQLLNLPGLVPCRSSGHWVKPLAVLTLHQLLAF